jgi:hypothetical protein
MKHIRYYNFQFAFKRILNLRRLGTIHCIDFLQKL